MKIRDLLRNVSFQLVGVCSAETSTCEGFPSRSLRLQFANQRLLPPADCTVCNLNPVGVRHSHTRTVARLARCATPPAGETPNGEVRLTGGRDSSERRNFNLAANHNTTPRRASLFFCTLIFTRRVQPGAGNYLTAAKKRKLLKGSRLGLSEAIFSYRCRRYRRY